MKTIFIEEPEQLTEVGRVSSFLIKRDDGNNKYYVVVSHLAAEIESNRLDLTASRVTFSDPAFASHFLEEFNREYNPFLLNQYELFKENFYYRAHSNDKGIKSNQIDFYLFRKKTTEQRTGILIPPYKGDYYAVHKDFPWIGMNVTKEFGLKIVSWIRPRIEDICLKKPNETNEGDAIRSFLEAWNNAQAASNCPKGLQEKAQQVLKAFFEEREKVQKNNTIYSKIRGLIEFQQLQDYTNNLKSSRNDNKKIAGREFSAFLTELNANNITTWVSDLNNFEVKFKDSFSAYPETCCCCYSFFPAMNDRADYRRFQDLKNKVVQILTQNNYPLPAPRQQASMNALSDNDETRPLLPQPNPQ